MRHLVSILCFAAACGVDDISDEELLAMDEQELAKPPPDDDGPVEDRPKRGPINPPPKNLHIRTSTDIASVLDFTCGKNADRNNWFRQTESGAFIDMGESPPCEDVMQNVWDVAIQPETNYCHYVASSNSTHSASTNTLCFKSPVPLTAPTPASIRIGALDRNAIELFIRDNSKTERYFRLYRRPVGAATWAVIHDQLRYNGVACGTQGTIMKGHRGSDCEYRVLDVGLTQDTKYEYFVEAGYFRDNATPDTPHVRSDSAIVRAHTLPPLPGAVTGLELSNIGERDMTASWNENTSFVDNYRLRIRRDSDDDIETKTVGQVSSTVIDDLVSGYRYCVSIQALNRAGAGPRSDEVCATTKEPAPPLIADLSVPGLNRPPFIPPNTSFNVTGQVCNFGTKDAGSFVLGLLVDPSGPAAETVAKTQTINSLAKQTCVPYSFTHSLGKGDYGMRVYADTNGSIVESNEVNNATGSDRVIVD